jgi:hypothetical protein
VFKRKQGRMAGPPPPPYAVVATNIGPAHQYPNTPGAQAALSAALARWFQAARNVGNPGWQVPQGAWLQVQTQPLGNAPGSILYNCGGIDPNWNGGYGADFVDTPLVNWLLANPTVAAPGLPNGQVTFQVNNAPTSTYVGSANYVNYRQEYYTVTARTHTIQYDQNYASHRLVLQALQNIEHNAQLFHGSDYQIVVNFHLYEGLPYQV